MWKPILKYSLFWSKTYIESDMSSKSIWYQIVKQRGIDQAWCTFIKAIQSQWHLDDVKRVFYDDIFCVSETSICDFIFQSHNNVAY